MQDAYWQSSTELAFFFLTNSHEEGDSKSSSLQHAGVDGAVLCLIIVALVLLSAKPINNEATRPLPKLPCLYTMSPKTATRPRPSIMTRGQLFH